MSILLQFFIVLSLVLLTSCGGGGGGNDSLPGDTTTDTFTISGTLFSASSTDVDSDINDINTNVVSNDTTASAQSISNPVTIGGYVNIALAGSAGNSYQNGDVNDYYVLELVENQQVVLNVSAAGTDNDLDLYLYDATTGSLIDSSIGFLSDTEIVNIPQDGEYFIRVNAARGASTYTLNIGQTTTSTAYTLNLSDDFVTGQAIIKMKDSADIPAGIQNIKGDKSHAQLVGFDLGLDLQTTDNTTLKAKTLEKIKALQGNANVLYAEPNYILQPLAEPNDEYYGLQWHYPLINLSQAWDITEGDADVIVAVIDTGVLLNHPDLNSKMTTGYDFISDPTNANDGDGIDSNPNDSGDGTLFRDSSYHGTHVAGTIAAESNNNQGVAGVSWKSTIMPLRALGTLGGTTYDINQAILYAAGLSNDSGTIPTQRAHIINMSLGGASFSQAQQDVITQAYQQGVIIVAASGNSNTDATSYPAGYNHVISVGAVDLNKSRAPYSNYGSTLDIMAPGGNTSADTDGDGYVDGVLSTLGDDAGNYFYHYYQGTSMASPHAAGVISLMLAINPNLTPDQIDALISSGDITEDLGSTGRDNIYGYGLINAYKAVLAAVESVNGTLPDVSSSVIVTPETLNFASNVNTAVITLTNPGNDNAVVTVNTITATDTWLSATADEIDTQGMGRYTISINRSGLTSSTYYADLIVNYTIDAVSDTLTIPVIMQVLSGSNDGNSGYTYVLLINSTTEEVVAQFNIGELQSAVNYSFSEVEEGSYYLIAGSDIDNDDYICDAGESCGGYPIYETLESIDINGNMSNLDFMTTFNISLDTISNINSNLKVLNNNNKGIGYAINK